MDTDGKNTMWNSKTGRTKEQGPFEIKFRHFLCKKLQEDTEFKIIFKEILMELFLSKENMSKKTSEVILINILCESIWKEFIDICKIKDIETAISIIFNRYEQ